jgi:hypothetical protein
MLNVAVKSIILCVIMLDVVMLIVVAPSIISFLPFSIEMYFSKVFLSN